MNAAAAAFIARPGEQECCVVVVGPVPGQGAALLGQAVRHAGYQVRVLVDLRVAMDDRDRADAASETLGADRSLAQFVSHSPLYGAVRQRPPGHHLARSRALTATRGRRSADLESVWVPGYPGVATIPDRTMSVLGSEVGATTRG